MNKIKFQHNWNGKLDCPYFTTIRKWTAEKERYYHSLISKEVEIVLNGTTKTYKKLVHVRIQRLDHIVNELILLDTGMENHKAIDLFKRFGIQYNDYVLVIMFGPVEA